MEIMQAGTPHIPATFEITYQKSGTQVLCWLDSPKKLFRNQVNTNLPMILHVCGAMSTWTQLEKGHCYSRLDDESHLCLVCLTSSYMN